MLLGVDWRRRGKLASERLIIEVGQLASRVLQEELALDGVGACKHIDKEHSEPQEKQQPVPVQQDVAIRD